MLIHIGDGKEYIATKQIISCPYNEACKAMISRNKLGDLSSLYQRLQPTDYDDFLVKYCEDGLKHKDNELMKYRRGRSVEELWELAKEYRELTGNFDIPLEVYMQNLITLAIIDTYDGQRFEREVGSYMTNKGILYDKPKNNEDSKYGIDFKVYGKDFTDLKCLIQVKPISFFRGDKNEALKQDRICAFEKYEICRKEYGVPTFYMVYDIWRNGMVKWLCKDGNFCLKLHELTNPDGTSILLRDWERRDLK